MLVGIYLREMKGEMRTAANYLEFEKASLLRDQIEELKRQFDPAGADDELPQGTAA